MDFETPRTVEILLIEDSAGDTRITIEAFQDAKIAARVHAVGNGAEALRILKRQPPYSDHVLPSLVLLDLNLPPPDGFDILMAMKADDNLRRIPVVVVSSRENPADVDRVYNLGASVYLRKPSDLDQYFTMIRVITDLWFRFAVLPSR